VKNVILVVGLLLLCFTVQPQSINGVPSQNVTGSGLPSSCTNLPCTMYSSQQTGQSAAININPFTPTVAGVYQLSCTMYVTTAGTAGTMQCGFNWRSGVTGGLASSVSSNTTSMTTLGSVTQITITAYSDGINAFTFFTNYTGTTGTPIYGIDVLITRIA
jgi:hypothetical protein